MRVIVATGLNAGSAEYRNMGDVAMLQAAVTRLMDLWPDAEVCVLTDSPADLARFCPAAVAIPREGLRCWAGDGILLGQYHRFLPRPVSLRLSGLKRSLRRRWPRFIERLVRWRIGLRKTGRRRSDFDAFMRALDSADLLLVAGAGGFADSCRAWNLSVLNTIEAARERGLPVALIGQGMGPLTDPEVLSRAAGILPEADLITLRGSRGGTSLLGSIGVNVSRVPVTGDEAVEAAWSARSDRIGDGIGINMRVASYSGIGAESIEPVRAALREFTQRYSAPLIPLPIAFHESARDHETIARILAGSSAEDDGGLSLDTPLKLIAQTARCRIVVTGAYHAAVFALAQGIPAVCLSGSAYYSAKFEGLQDLFGAGCAIVNLDVPDPSRRLVAAMDEAWISAKQVRASLLNAARIQAELSRAAYGQLRKLVRRGAIEPQPQLAEIRN
jgi:polysaccharide pyruvyl transferase WcaK-like protein